jgi:hypothetical protein
MTLNLTVEIRSALAGRYRIEREFGAGGMGHRVLARDLKHERSGDFDAALPVAMRPIELDPQFPEGSREEDEP